MNELFMRHVGDLLMGCCWAVSERLAGKKVQRENIEAFQHESCGLKWWWPRGMPNVWERRQRAKSLTPSRRRVIIALHGGAVGAACVGWGKLQ